MSAPEPADEHVDAVAILVDEWLFRMHGITSSCDHRTEAKGLLTSTDPAVHGAMLDALVRAGVLTEERYSGGNPAFMATRRLVSRWGSGGSVSAPEVGDRSHGEVRPSYHDLHITTAKIPRTSIFNLPYGYEVTCTRVGGWRLWRDGDLIAGEYDRGLILDVAGSVIVRSHREL